MVMVSRGREQGKPLEEQIFNGNHEPDHLRCANPLAFPGSDQVDNLAKVVGGYLGGRLSGRCMTETMCSIVVGK